MITLPPFDDGAVQDTVADELVTLEAEILVGLLGTVAGTTAVEAAEDDDVPIALVAVTVNV